MLDNPPYHLTWRDCFFPLARYQSRERWRPLARVNPNQFVPPNRDGLETLGVVMQALGDRKGASQCFHNALKIRPDYGELYSNLGNLAREEGRFEVRLLLPPRH